MQYTFQMPAKETVDFQTRFQLELARKITPRWITVSVGYAYYIAVAVSAYVISGKFWDAYWMLIAVTILHSAMYRSYRAVVRNHTVSYLQRQPDSETWTVEIAGDYLCAENRGVRTCFPLDLLTDTKEEKGLLIFRFGERAAARMPLSVFSTTGTKDAFLAQAKVPKN